MDHYDIIGDVHGCATKLLALLGKLGYRRDEAGVYRHPESTAVFVGDLIDRGDEQLQVLQLVKAMVDACMAKWGRIDILDNNVGIGSTGGPVELSEDDWHKVFDVNVTSFFLTAKHVLPVMEKQKKGAIVNVSSIASIRVPKGISYVAYNASKGAVNSLTMAIASEYAEKGIRCNAILPGLMHTPMIDFLAEEYAKGEKDHNQAYDKMIAIRNRASPTGKMGTGWDTANAALFLASDEAGYVNGHLLVVDGGITTRA